MAERADSFVTLPYIAETLITSVKCFSACPITNSHLMRQSNNRKIAVVVGVGVAVVVAAILVAAALSFKGRLQ